MASISRPLQVRKKELRNEPVEEILNCSVQGK